MLVVSQIRRDFVADSNYEKLTKNIEKALFKAIRNVLLKNNFIETKE
jgi:hypothetical protein